MANAKKCDRCDKYFDENTVKRTVEDYAGKMLPVEGLRISTRVDSRGSTMISDRYDLCDECWEKFFNWMCAWELEEEVEDA